MSFPSTLSRVTPTPSISVTPTTPITDTHAPTMEAVMLIREEQTDLSPFPERHIQLARTQWLAALHERLAALNLTLANNAEAIDYGGPASSAVDFRHLEESVDEARRMVYALGGEMRRRSEGVLVVWNPKEGHVGQGSAIEEGKAKVGFVGSGRRFSSSK